VTFAPARRLFFRCCNEETLSDVIRGVEPVWFGVGRRGGIFAEGGDLAVFKQEYAAFDGRSADGVNRRPDESHRLFRIRSGYFG
jgi:hypothetical protein